MIGTNAMTPATQNMPEGITYKSPYSTPYEGTLATERAGKEAQFAQGAINRAQSLYK